MTLFGVSRGCEVVVCGALDLTSEGVCDTLTPFVLFMSWTSPDLCCVDKTSFVRLVDVKGLRLGTVSARINRIDFKW